MVDPQALHDPPNAALVVVEVNDGVDAAWAVDQGEANRGDDDDDEEEEEDDDDEEEEEEDKSHG